MMKVIFRHQIHPLSFPLLAASSSPFGRDTGPKPLTLEQEEGSSMAWKGPERGEG